MAILSLCSSPNSSTKPPEGNGLLMGQNILQISFGLGQMQLSNCKGSLPCILNIKRGNESNYINIKKTLMNHKENRILCKESTQKWKYMNYILHKKHVDVRTSKGNRYITMKNIHWYTLSQLQSQLH